MTTDSRRTAIQHLAYDIYQARGRLPGREMDDWLLAEKELLAKESSPHPGGHRPTRVKGLSERDESGEDAFEIPVSGPSIGVQSSERTLGKRN
jgi:hypothetical protein